MRQTVVSVNGKKIDKAYSKNKKIAKYGGCKNPPPLNFL